MWFCANICLKLHALLGLLFKNPRVNVGAITTRFPQMDAAITARIQALESRQRHNILMTRENETESATLSKLSSDVRAVSQVCLGLYFIFLCGGDKQGSWSLLIVYLLSHFRGFFTTHIKPQRSLFLRSQYRINEHIKPIFFTFFLFILLLLLI